MNWKNMLFSLLLCSSVLHAFPPDSAPEAAGAIGSPLLQDNTEWHGQTFFFGSVKMFSCLLVMEDAWQSVSIQDMQLRDLQKAEKGKQVGVEKNFKLHTQGCGLSDSRDGISNGNHIRIIFDGIRGDGPDKFSLEGQAKGVDLQIFDQAGHVIRIGEALPLLAFHDNEQSLQYTLRLIRNSQPLIAGDYYTSLRVRMDYQ